MTDFDSPWKEALEFYLRPGLALLLPIIHDNIDWDRGVEAQDTELRKLMPDAKQGMLYVDRLFKVWAKNGALTWLLLHIEVQAWRDTDFPRRMYDYSHRIEAQYNQDVVSVAILADSDAKWRPDHYEWNLWGCRKRLDFPHVKLLDFLGHEVELEASANPFAKVVLAHIKAMEMRGDDAGRYTWKLRIVRVLFEQGFSKGDVEELFRLIDWLMDLPTSLAGRFWAEVKQIQKEKNMPFITTPQRIEREEGLQEGMEKGLEEGMQKGRQVGWREGLLAGIETLLRVRFGEDGRKVLPAIQAIQEQERLLAINAAIAKATTLDEARQSWEK